MCRGHIEELLQWLLEVFKVLPPQDKEKKEHTFKINDKEVVYVNHLFKLKAEVFNKSIVLPFCVDIYF